MIHVQKISQRKNIPSTALIKKWVFHALNKLKKNSAEITIRIVNNSESQKLNKAYRNKDYPTNVLSFGYQIKPIMGDIVLCAPLIPVYKKNTKNKKNSKWAHLIIHGVLHLIGYDHETQKDALKMESLEITLLSQLGFDNPYDLSDLNSSLKD